MVWGNKKQSYDFEKPHRHNFNEVLIYYKGGGTHDIDFTTYESKDRSLHFVASDNVHLVLNNKEDEGCSLLFENDFIDKDLTERLPFNKSNPVLQLNEEDFLSLDGLIERIKSEYSKKQKGYEMIIQAYLQTFMLHLIRMYESQNPEGREGNAKPEIINKFIVLIRENYIKHETVEQYASMLNVSAKHLIDLCKTHTGKTPLRHIRDHIISEAKKLLFNTKLSVKEIAYELGFDEPGNFSKYFKNASGYSPVEYREGIR